MILLEFSNRIIQETLRTRIEQYQADKTNLPALDVTLADFDGVQFHISSDPKTPNLVRVSLQWRCAGDLRKNGGDEVLKAAYGNLLQGSAENSYDITLQLDLESPKDQLDSLPSSVALFKRHLLAGPFKRIFEAVEKGQSVNPVFIQYRDEEGFFIKPEGDRVIVIYEIHFKDPDDQVLGKVFLQEFQDARRNLNNVPAVSFTQKDPPLELKGVKGIKSDALTGFVSLGTIIPLRTREKTINTVQTFRDYLHYHIKCSKAFMHDRMRKRTESMLQVLNRAKAEPLEPREKKTITGKTFKPAGGSTPGKGPVSKGIGKK